MVLLHRATIHKMAEKDDAQFMSEDQIRAVLVEALPLLCLDYELVPKKRKLKSG